MKLGTKCTVCGERVDSDEVVRCDQCGDELHSTCTDFEKKYECGQCGNELWIGAVEF
jgi:DNA-directed RNA polymerase subunit RPC12/RpoP